MAQQAMRTKLQGVRRSLRHVEVTLAAIEQEQMRDTAASAATRLARERIAQALTHVAEALGEPAPALITAQSVFADEG